MALFTDSLDQTRQAETVQRRGLTGQKRQTLALYGYNKHGEKNTWGKVMPFLSFGGDMASRLAANKVAKGTQAGDTLKETNKEYWAAKGSQAKFTLEAAKLIGGAISGASSTVGSGTTTPSLATTPITNTDPTAIASVGADAVGGGDVSSVLSGGSGSISSIGGDVASAMSGGNNTLDMPNTGLGSEGLNEPSFNMSSEPYKGAMESEVGQEIEALKADSAVKDTEDELNKDIEKEKSEVENQEEKTEKELTEEEKKNQKLNKIKDKVNKAVPIVGAGIDWYQKSKAVVKEEDRFKKKQLSRKVMANYNLI